MPVRTGQQRLPAGPAVTGAVGRLRQDLDDRVRAGLAWWLGELREMLPRRAGRTARRAPVALEFAEGRAAVRVHGTAGGRPARVAVDLDSPEQAAAQVHAALRQAGRGTAVAVELQPEAVLETELTLPRAAERALRPILLNQLERVVPLPPDQVEFAYAVRPRRPADPSMQVRLTVATRATIDGALDLARRLGLRPEQVVAGAGDGGQPPMALWRSGGAGSGHAAGRRARNLLELGTAGLLIAAFAFYLVRLDQQAESLQQLIADKVLLADAAMKLAKERDAAEAALKMMEARRAQPTPLKILDELTGLVPDDSWLSRLQVQGWRVEEAQVQANAKSRIRSGKVWRRSVEIVGVSPNVSGLVDRINTDPLLKDPRFLSPITGTDDGRAQRFDLSMTIEEPVTQ